MRRMSGSCSRVKSFTAGYRNKKRIPYSHSCIPTVLKLLLHAPSATQLCAVNSYY